MPENPNIDKFHYNFTNVRICMEILTGTNSCTIYFRTVKTCLEAIKMTKRCTLYCKHMPESLNRKKI